MFTIDNKFEVDQEVFLIEKNKHTIEKTETCDICFGEGQFKYQGYLHRCSKCEGKGKHILESKRIARYEVNNKPYKITSVKFMLYGKDNVTKSSLKYKVNDYLWKKKSYILHMTKHRKYVTN